MPSQAWGEQQNPAATGLIHRMLDVPRGCALSHWLTGAAGGLVKRPKFEVWAIQSQEGRPPGPLLHLHQTHPKSAAVTSLDSGQACRPAADGPQVSRRGNLEGTVNGNLQIWSLSSPIPRGFLFGRTFRGQKLGLRQPAERVGIREDPLVLGTSVRLCFYASLPGTVLSLTAW